MELLAGGLAGRAQDEHASGPTVAASHGRAIRRAKHFLPSRALGAAVVRTEGPDPLVPKWVVYFSSLQGQVESSLTGLERNTDGRRTAGTHTRPSLMRSMAAAPMWVMMTHVDNNVGSRHLNTSWEMGPLGIYMEKGTTYMVSFMAPVTSRRVASFPWGRVGRARVLFLLTADRYGTQHAQRRKAAERGSASSGASPAELGEHAALDHLRGQAVPLFREPSQNSTASGVVSSQRFQQPT